MCHLCTPVFERSGVLRFWLRTPSQMNSRDRAIYTFFNIYLAKTLNSMAGSNSAVVLLFLHKSFAFALAYMYRNADLDCDRRVPDVVRHGICSSLLSASSGLFAFQAMEQIKVCVRREENVCINDTNVFSSYMSITSSVSCCHRWLGTKVGNFGLTRIGAS